MTDEEQRYKDLKREFDNSAFRRRLKESKPDHCVGCKSKENLEYHHILPLKFGGSNDFENIVPLCHKCHKAVHCSQHMSHYSDQGNGGRKPKATIEKHSEIFDMYIRGEIGNQKCKELLGVSSKTQLSQLTEFKRYIASKGIKKVRNTVDILGANTLTGATNGAFVGEVYYVDGHVARMVFKDTGKNDVEYKKRKDITAVQQSAERLGELYEKEPAPLVEEGLEWRLSKRNMHHNTCDSPNGGVYKNMRREREMAEERIWDYAVSNGISNVKELCDTFGSSKYAIIVNKVMRGALPEEALSEILLAG